MTATDEPCVAPVIKVTPEEVRAARIEVRALRSAGLTPDPQVVKLAEAAARGRPVTDEPCVCDEREAAAIEAAAHSLEVNHRHLAEAARILRHYAAEHRVGADRLARYAATEDDA